MSLLDEVLKDSRKPVEGGIHGALKEQVAIAPHPLIVATDVSTVSREGIYHFLDSFMKRGSDVPEIMDFVDDGETLTIYHKDGSLHAHYGPESYKAVREYIAREEKEG